MKKKKLQLKELKVKSFITVVNKEEQRTAKGGYVNYNNFALAQNVLVGSDIIVGPWTSEKTRATGSEDVLIGFGRNGKSRH